MKTSNKLLLVLALAAFLSTASIMLYAKSEIITQEEYQEQMKLSGNAIKKVLHEDLTTYNIEMGDNFSWILDPNSTQVIVEGDETIVSKLTVSDGKQFQVRTGEYGDYNIDYDMVIITVGTKNLSKLRIEGNGNAKISAKEPIQMESLEVDMNGNSKCTLDITTVDIRIDINGNGRLTLDGSCEDINANVNGNGRIYAEKLATNKVKINANGNARFNGGTVESIKGDASGNAKIKVEESRGSSNVSTSGNAKFTISR